MIAEEYRKDYTYLDFEPEHKERSGKVTTWLSLLFIPLFTFIGWTARDYFVQKNDSLVVNRMEYGVGGGPETNGPCVVEEDDQLL